MKKNMIRGIVLLLAIAVIMIGARYYDYSRIINEVIIVQYFDSRANDLNW